MVRKDTKKTITQNKWNQLAYFMSVFFLPFVCFQREIRKYSLKAPFEVDHRLKLKWKVCNPWKVCLILLSPHTAPGQMMLCFLVGTAMKYDFFFHENQSNHISQSNSSPSFSLTTINPDKKSLPLPLCLLPHLWVAVYGKHIHAAVSL